MSKKSSEQPMVLFKHLRNMQQIRPPPITCVPERFTLDQIAAYNIHIDTGDTKTSSIVTLREVPSFLIEAFSKFEQLEGCKVEGVFRKEGNSLRCKDDATPVFFGAQSISSSFHVHDVCSWIKKFFRELKQPLFINREQQLIKFAEDLEGELLWKSLLSLLDRLPASHMGTLGYLMRCLQEISESSHLHQMTVENLATVFAPSIFRGINHQDSREPTKLPSKKNRNNGSQDDLLRSLKRTNDLQVKVIKVLIENAGKIGAAQDCYKASRSASDAKNKERKLIASTAQRNAEVTSSKPPHCYGGAEKRINSALMKKNSRSSSNLATEPSTSSLLSQRNNSDDDGLNTPRKAKQKRSNSVVRILQSFKKSVTNLTSDAFQSTPDPPGLANKKIPKPTATKTTSHHQYSHRQPQTPIKQSVSMDPSTCTSSDDTLSSDFARSKKPPHPEYVGVNFQEIRKVMSPKDSKKRPPIPNFDNSRSCTSSNDEKKENDHDQQEEIENSSTVIKATTKASILRKRSSSGSKKPMGVSNSTNVQVQRALTLLPRREQPLKVDRCRRSTAPVKTSIKRMQPVSRASGLTLSRTARSFQRRASSRRSGSNTSTSSDSRSSPSDINTHDPEQKGVDAVRRRRRMKKKENSESLTNMYNTSTTSATNSPTKTYQQQHSISPVISSTNNTSIEPTSDLPLTSDISSPELQRATPAFISPSAADATTPKGSMISLLTPKKKSPPPLSIDVTVAPQHQQREPLPLITPSPDSGCSLASSKQLQTDTSSSSNNDHVFAVPELPPPRRFVRPAHVDIKPSGTSIYLHTESSRAKQKSPVRKSPLPHTPARRSSSATSARESSKSPARRPRPQVIPASPSDHQHFNFENINDDTFDGNEKQIILNSTSNDQCFFPEMGRPSIAQIQNTGVVNRRIQHFKKLSNNSLNLTAGRGISGTGNLSFTKPAGKPASHGLLWKRTNVNETISEQPTKSERYASNRAKSVNSMYSTHQHFLGSVRPSVSATTQLPSSTTSTRKIECGTTVSRYNPTPKNT